MSPIQHSVSITSPSDLVKTITRFDKPKDISTQDQQCKYEKGFKSGIRYLEKSVSPITGFQCKVGKTRELNGALECPTEIFTSALILDALEGIDIDQRMVRSIIDLLKKNQGYGIFNFFVDRSLMPDDIDDTAMCLTVLLNHGEFSMEHAKAIGRALTLHVTQGGIIDSFFPPCGTRNNRVDAIALANVMRFLYKLGLEDYAEKSADYIESVIKGTPSLGNGYIFYHSPDAVLYFVSNLLKASPKAERFRPHLLRLLKEAFGRNAFPLDIAMRIIAAENLGVIEEFKAEVEKEGEKLLEIQKKDGSWSKDSIYRYKDFHFGSRATSTAFAAKALHILADL